MTHPDHIPHADDVPAMLDIDYAFQHVRRAARTLRDERTAVAEADPNDPRIVDMGRADNLHNLAERMSELLTVLGDLHLDLSPED